MSPVIIYILYKKCVVYILYIDYCFYHIEYISWSMLTVLFDQLLIAIFVEKNLMSFFFY